MYVIAEAGVNHDGRLEQALRLVAAARAAGADGVKFQVFRAAELATAAAPTAAYQAGSAGGSQRELLSRLELSDADFRRIRDHCRAVGIDFLATPFSPSDVRRLVELDVPALKIASTDLNNPPLLHAAATTGRPLIVSTGAATAAEIHAAVQWLADWGAAGRLILLHCVSAYPTPLAAANLRAIGALRDAFGVPCGFSDHTTATAVGAWAVAAGAGLLEKHFTLDRSASGPDHAMSLDPPQLAEYVAGVRQAEAALGDGRRGLTPLEAEVRAVARKSVVAAVPLRAGVTLTPEMLTLKRPGGGIPPEQLPAVVGHTVVRDVPADTVLTWDALA